LAIADALAALGSNLTNNVKRNERIHIMNGRRKPRQPKRISYNSIRGVILRASRLTNKEIESNLAPVRRCEKALREGVANETQHQVLETTLRISDCIEKSRIVRGLSEHIASAQEALETVGNRSRCARTGTWKQTTLSYEELDAIHAAIGLYEFQLRRLSAGELNRIVNSFLASVRTQGGEIVRVPLDRSETLGLQQADSH